MGHQVDYVPSARSAVWSEGKRGSIEVCSIQSPDIYFRFSCFLGLTLDLIISALGALCSSRGTKFVSARSSKGQVMKAKYTQRLSLLGLLKVTSVVEHLFSSLSSNLQGKSCVLRRLP